MTTIYVDSLIGDDLNAGTLVAPKKTPRGAQNASATGDTILLKAGLCYSNFKGVAMFFSGVSNIEVGSYGTASDLPCIDGLTYEAPGVGGWTYISGGIWKKVFGAFYVRRLWINSINNGVLTSQRTVGNAMRRATGTGLTTTSPTPTEAQILAGLNSNNIWFGGGSAVSRALYMYTGSSAIDPSTYYQGIAFIQSDVTGLDTAFGFAAGIHVQNQRGIHAHDLHIRGSGSTAIRVQAANADSRDAQDCLFENMLVTAPYQGAFKTGLVGEATPTKAIRGITARNIYCDYLTSSDEQELNKDYDYLSGAVDLFNVADGSVGVTVEGCTAIGSAHFGIAVGSIAMATTPPKGIRIINNIIKYEPYGTYSRGLGCYDADALFQGNLIIGQNTRSQMQGSCRVVANVWKDMRTSIRKPDVDEWINIESYVYNSFTAGIGNEAYVKVSPINVRIWDNVVFGPKGPCMSLNHFNSGLADTSNTFADGTVEIRNNIIVSPQQGFIRTYQDTGRVVGVQTVSKNCIWNNIVGDNKVLWIGSNYTINAAPGFANNLEVDPVVNKQYRPLNPLVQGLGDTIIGNDYYGIPFSSSPNLGAVQAITEHRSVTSRTTTSRTATTRCTTRRNTTI